MAFISRMGIKNNTDTQLSNTKPKFMSESMQKRKTTLIAIFLLLGLNFLWSKFFSSGTLSLKDFLELIPNIISLLGILGYDDEKKKRKKRIAKPFSLTPSFYSGLFGGLIGGTLAGLIIGVMYYIVAITEGAGWEIIPHIIIYSSLTGVLLGVFSQLTIIGFRKFVTECQYPAFVFNEVSGGVLGGLIGGIIAGATGGWLFGLLPLPFIDITLLVTGSLFGTPFIVLGILLYDYDGRWQNIIRSILISVLITVFAAILGIAILEAVKIDNFFSTGEVIPVIEGGAVLGLVIGAVLGLQIGLTLCLYRLSEVETKS